MKDLQTREMMGKLYRLIEEYETPPKLTYQDEYEAYFDKAARKMLALAEQYKGNEFAADLLVGWYSAIEKRFLAVNTLPFQERRENTDG